MTRTLCLFLTIACLAASDVALARERAIFDAASIRVSQADTNELAQTDKGIRRPAYHPFRFTPGRVSCTLPLVSIIAQAYGLKIWQIAGPSWLYDGAYEITATMPADTTREQADAMLRSLLADRFEMKSHREMRDLAVYELTQVRGAARLTESREGDSPEFINNASSIRATKVTMQGLADWLNNRVDRPVLDRTGLTGSYNIELKWTPEYVESDVRATDFGLLRAMESEVGLKLTATKSSQPILVVDQAGKTPREN
jgi:uncharacterized protein (TIGR03435 family)